MICDECLKELKPKDQPYKCFGKGLERGQKDMINLQLKLAKAESKLKAIRLQMTYIKGYGTDKHWLKIMDILNDDSELGDKE